MAGLQKFIIQTSKTSHGNTGLEIYLRSSKSQIAFYADINSKPMPMASYRCIGPREIMHKNQQRNVLQQRGMEESHTKREYLCRTSKRYRIKKFKKSIC